MTQTNGKFPCAYLGQPDYEKLDNIKYQSKY